MIITTKEFLPSPSTRPIGFYLTIGYWGLGLEFGIGIREWNFDSELGIETWDWRLGLGIGIWDSDRELVTRNVNHK